MVRFCKNGSDATSAAVRLSRAATSRDVVLVCHDQPYFSSQDWFVGVLPINSGVPEPTRALVGTFGYNDVDSFQRALEDHRMRVACVILEPATVLVEPAPGFLDGVRLLCTEHGAVLVFDEMITDFRWSQHGAQGCYGVTPDVSTWGNAMANGFPLAALAGRRELMELGGRRTSAPRVFLLSSTHGADAVSLAAVRAVVRAYRERDVIGIHGAPGPSSRGRGGRRGRRGSYRRAPLGRGPSVVPDVPDRGRVRSAVADHAHPVPAGRSCKRGVLGQSFVISAVLTDADVAQTAEAARGATVVYTKALESGRPEDLFHGRPVAPAHRRYANPRRLPAASPAGGM